MDADRSILASVLFTLFFVILHTSVSALATDLLTITLYKVTHDGALIDWHFDPSYEIGLEYCEYVYGPVSDKELKQVSPDFVPNTRTIDLSDLDYNMTYYLHMVCYDKNNNTFRSNTITFTTGNDAEEPVNFLMSSSQRIPANPVDSPYPVSMDVERPDQSSNVILGAVAGIIGFLIINVTIVLAIRKYSHWQTRRRRIIELEDRDYDGFEYLRDIE